MSETHRIHWARVAIEGITIIVSILLAFGIDALWANRQATIEEQATLRSLKDDFVASRASLSFVLRTIDGHRARLSQFETGVLPQAFGQSPDSITLLMSSLALSITFDASSGTLEALVGDGRLDTLGDSELRDALSEWRTRLADLEENKSDVRAESRRVVHALEAHGGPFYASIMPEDDLTVFRRADPTTLSAIRGDEVLMGHTRSLYAAYALSLRELRALTPVLDTTLARIDADIR